MRTGVIRVGVISDTHGLLRPEAIVALRGVDHILHAGDIGDIQILDTLRTLAPLTAIRGNIDRTGPCAQLPPTEFIELGGHAIYMLHDLVTLDLDPSAAGISAIVSGHSHKPGIERRKGVLYFNPGSAGPRRFSLPISLGILEIDASGITPQLVELSVK
ncbi:MAG TPA: metallophosphoesterase family protein [Acidobacteriaceae bacterium]|nr:metallophosphoesterase family protein [Acidobacteriaceae bacterium]